MVDFNGSGGLAGFNPFGSAPSGPAMSAGQINSSMGYNPNANPYDPFAQSGGFGAMTDYYSGLGAAYGRNTGGFGGYGAANADPFTPVGGGGGGLATLPNGQINQNDPGNVALYWKLMGGGGSAQPFNDYGGGANPGGFSPSLNYPGGNDPGPMSLYNSGGYNPYSSQTFAPSAQPNTGGMGGWSPAYNPGGGLNINDPGNIAAYYAMIGGGGGRDQLAQTMQGGSSNSPPYQGNPYYLPQPMQGGQALQGGGGFGAGGFGLPGSGYMGMGMGIGNVGEPQGFNAGQAFGTVPSQNPFGGGTGYGFGGFTGSPNELVNGNAGG